jgi:hypothetical protein
VYDRYYIEYLRYALAEFLCAEYNIQFQPQSQKKLDELERVLLNISPPDLSMDKMSTLTGDTGGSNLYVQANLGHGWTS